MATGESVYARPGPDPRPSPIDGLVAAFLRLDQFLAGVCTGATDDGGETETGSYRGMYVSAGDVCRWLARPPGQPRLKVGPGAEDPAAFLGTFHPPSRF